MSYKRLIWLQVLVFASTVLCAQTSYLKYAWSNLGPFVTPASTADSGQWSSTGMGWVESLYVSDNGEDLYAGTITGGLYASKDAGIHWKQVYQNGIQMGILDILVNGSELFIATGVTHYDDEYGLGILCSKNGGKTWKPTGLSFKPIDHTPIWGIELASDEKTMIAISSSAIYQSPDKAKNWTKTFEAKDMDLRHLEVSKFNSDLVLVGGKRFLRSADKGLTWTDLTDSLSAISIDNRKQIQRVAIAIDPNQAGRVLVAYTLRGYLWLDESLDDGLTWASLHKSRSIKRFDKNHAELSIAPGNSAVICIGAVRFFVSKTDPIDFTLTTTPAYLTAQFVHDDIRSVVLLDDLHYYLGTDGGVSSTSDGGITWQNRSGQGLTAVMAYGVGLGSQGITIGCQDLGSFIYKDQHWIHLGEMYGDGGDALQVGEKMYIMTGGRPKAVSIADNKPVYVNSPPSKMSPFTAKYAHYPGSTDSFFYLSDHLWRYDGKDWLNLTNGLDNKGYKATCFTVNSKHPDIMYFAFDQPTWGSEALNKKFFRSLDGGKSWTNLTDNLPILQWRYVSSVVTNPDRPSEVYVSLGMIDDGEINKVYRSNDGGETWENWSEGLSALPTFKIMFLEGSSSGLLLATMDGMYYRNSTMDSWLHLLGEIPEIAIRDFEIDYLNKKIYSATYGNGLWELSLSDEMWKY